MIAANINVLARFSLPIETVLVDKCARYVQKFNIMVALERKQQKSSHAIRIKRAKWIKRPKKQTLSNSFWTKIQFFNGKIKSNKLK